MRDDTNSLSICGGNGGSCFYFSCVTFFYQFSPGFRTIYRKSSIFSWLANGAFVGEPFFLADHAQNYFTIIMLMQQRHTFRQITITTCAVGSVLLFLFASLLRAYIS